LPTDLGPASGPRFFDIQRRLEVERVTGTNAADLSRRHACTYERRGLNFDGLISM
jgi:hypothetical protein